MASNTGGTGGAQSSQAQQDDTNLAGLTAAFGNLAQVGSQVVELQGTLAAGVVRSQQREADRLAGAYGKNDPRVALAGLRAQYFSDLHDEVMSHAGQISNFVDGMQTSGTFHGYVYLSDGSAGSGYTVRAEVTQPAHKQIYKAEAKTDATGYFRMDLSSATQNMGQSSGTDRLLEMVRQPETPGSPAAAGSGATPGGGGSTSPASGALTTTVNVVNSGGRVVLQDPHPPTFEAMSSEFRLYTVDVLKRKASTAGRKK